MARPRSTCFSLRALLLACLLSFASLLLASSAAFAQARFCVDHDTLVFGDRPVGSSTSVTVNVGNCGTASYGFTDVSVHPATGPGFGVSGSCATGVVLAPEESCTLDVRFAPSAAGQQSGAVWLHNTSSTPDQLVTFYARGTDASAGTSSLAFSPSPLQFGTQQVGSASAPIVLELRNRGSVAIVPSALVMNGPAAYDFNATGSCAVGVAIAPGGACQLAFTFSPRAAGLRLANLNVDAPQLASIAVLQVSGTGASASAPAAVPIVEYYHAPSDSYFLTADPDEAALLDAGTLGPWQRTGRVLRGWDATGNAPSSAVPVCRFWGAPGRGPASHFYTTSSVECGIVRNDPYWIYEGLGFRVLPLTTAGCPSGSDTVQRLFKPAPDVTGIRHRFVVAQADVDAMRAAGWWLEGPVFCSARQ